VVGEGLAAGRDVGDKLPRLAFVGGGVEVDVRAGEVGGDGAAREQDRVGGETAEGPVEDVEERLVAEAWSRIRV